MRRGRTKVSREVTRFKQASYCQKKNHFQPMSIFSEDEIESIHEASLKVLCDTGIDIQSPRAVEILKKAGATIDSDGKRVRFEPGFVMEKIATTPSEFTLHGRHKERHVHIGGESVVNTMVASAPNVSDLDRGRILGNFEDYSNLIKLGEILNTVHAFGGYPVEPCDIEAGGCRNSM
jgi:trimethylamine--corrinoid protein Co-methyltransferase